MNKPVGTDFEYESVLAYIRKGRLGGGAYFKDGLKKVHYVLVLSMTSAYTNVDVISHIIRQLEDMGLEFEQDLGITIPVIFIKIHIPDEATEVYLGTYGVNEDFIYGFDYADRSESSVFKTPVQKKNVFQDIRSRELSVIKVKVIHQMLIEIPFGEGEDKRGLPKLCKRGIFQDYYPLHDGNIQYEYWYNDDLLNDRTLLAKYWANYYVWYKEQPLDLINKYYGSEIAFYFAWCAFYNMMLTPIAVLGTILSCISIGHRLMYPLDITETICNSKLPVCGLCMKGYGCTQNPLSDSCGDYTIASVLTHSILTGYAVVVTIWGICFNKMWSRKEYILKIRWNLLGKELEKDSKLRIEFQEKAEKLVMDGQIVYRLKETSKFSRRAVGIIGYILINQQFNIPFERGIGLLKNDSCDPLPCVTPLFVQLMILMTLKVILEKIFVICYPKCKGLIKSYMKEQLKKSQMPQYEEEYGKISQQFCFLDVNFSGKVIQYALLISFIYGFPLGPMCCLIQNVLSLRMEAIDMIYESRRPAYTRQSQGIGIWNTVLMTLTHVGGMINIFTIAFASDGIIEFHRPVSNDSNEIFMFSEFHPYNVFGKSKNSTIPDKCLFRGMYNSPYKINRYSYSFKFWNQLTKQLYSILLLQILCFGMVFVVDYILPTIPPSVKKKRFDDRTNLDNKYNKEFNKKLEQLLHEHGKKK
ncbi:anoctamin-4 isoform X4 [Aethina tumida]|uniref:anoctamin-4 isoform X4 n=1 Tax=Aethina tumida TaxID=116153 RepID=UPI002148DFE6|nr:anoctamin-4 isoform X4 [Aethina tumida]